jgi:hypothetical protein
VQVAGVARCRGSVARGRGAGRDNERRRARGCRSGSVLRSCARSGSGRGVLGVGAWRGWARRRAAGERSEEREKREVERGCGGGHRERESERRLKKTSDGE